MAVHQVYLNRVPDQAVFKDVEIEYLNIPTLRLTDAKAQSDLLGEAIAKMHAMPANPYPKKTQVAEFLQIYRDLKQQTVVLKELDEAVEELQRLDREICQFKAPKATLHGDLHPRNWFLTTDRKVLAVDWEMTNVDNPFYDLVLLQLGQSHPSTNQLLKAQSFRNRHEFSRAFIRESASKRNPSN